MSFQLLILRTLSLLVHAHCYARPRAWLSLFFISHWLASLSSINPRRSVRHSMELTLPRPALGRWDSHLFVFLRSPMAMYLSKLCGIPRPTMTLHSIFLVLVPLRLSNRKVILPRLLILSYSKRLSVCWGKEIILVYTCILVCWSWNDF